MESSMAADTLRIEAVDPETLLEELVGQAVDVWADAHGLGRASATRREFGGDRVPRHPGRDGFVFLSALADNGRVIRFYEHRGWRVLLRELRFEPGRPVFAILGKELRQ